MCRSRTARPVFPSIQPSGSMLVARQIAEPLRGIASIVIVLILTMLVVNDHLKVPPTLRILSFLSGPLRMGDLKFVNRRSLSNWVQLIPLSLLVPSWCQNTMTHHAP